MDYVIAAIATLATFGALALAAPEPSIPGDDNGDGVVMEDESGWNCLAMGNLICGPIREA